MDRRFKKKRKKGKGRKKKEKNKKWKQKKEERKSKKKKGKRKKGEEKEKREERKRRQEKKTNVMSKEEIIAIEEWSWQKNWKEWCRDDCKKNEKRQMWDKTPCASKFWTDRICSS